MSETSEPAESTTPIACPAHGRAAGAAASGAAQVTALGRAGGLLGAGAVAAVLSGCGAPASPLSAAQILQYDSPSHTVTLTADAAYGGLGGDMNFDGYANGRLTVTVPYGWIVEVHCTNSSTLLSHSCAVVGDTPPLQSIGLRPLAFQRASSPDPYDGMKPGSSTTFEFLADKAGRYRLACLVHGHELDGMYDYVVVGPPGSLPSVSIATS